MEAAGLQNPTVRRDEWRRDIGEKNKVRGCCAIC
jgi:hypothetical protein